jgi:O-antigen/teichoic acid export membrane protein
VLLVLTQGVLIPLLMHLPNLPGEGAFRAILAAACLGGVIELPLAFWRLKGKSGRFLAFVAARSLLQAVIMVAALEAGWGVDGVLYGNACVDGAIVVALMIAVPNGTRPRLTRAAFNDCGRYGAPIVLGSFAMFALGACDRWFLVGAISPVELAEYALAAKLALAVALVIQPFGLWWYPRRIAVLQSPTGLRDTARFWSYGIAAIGLGGVLVCLAGQAFIAFLLPASYAGAAAYLPALVLAIGLNEVASLSNVVAYARKDGWDVLLVNGLGAGVALALYLVLIPVHGAWGAIFATICGHLLRVVVFLTRRYGGTRIPYPIVSSLLLMGMAGVNIWLVSSAQTPLVALNFGVMAVAAMGLAVMAFVMRNARHLRSELP